MSDYHYPHAQQIYPDTPQKSYRLKRLRFWLRTCLHQKQIKLFSQFVNQHPMLIPLLTQRPNYSYPLIHRFLDKRFNATQRLQAVCKNLTFLPEQLAMFKLAPLWEKSISFGEIIPDFELRLNINEHQPMEGFWALELYQKSTHQLVYLLTFGKVKNDLLVGVIQGSNQANAKELVKQLTKQCYGLRPAYLMVESMKCLAAALGYQQLLGIPHKYQNKSRFIQSKRYVVDYDTIFRESGGSLADYWQMSVQIDKSLERVPSKKRSMYRKRFALLEQIENHIHTALNINS
ncbi:VirK/YbjX family protein [Actinobacillus vicugnae]|uniref:VirK/YbjX family protein n=1 Tax=Actinobacillus vicugnae TaxID=2573093 RepID=UPI0012408BF5|nr:VirK/YbjX family protein [Actinobacillus vicugnae]